MEDILLKVKKCLQGQTELEKAVQRSNDYIQQSIIQSGSTKKPGQKRKSGHVEFRNAPKRGENGFLLVNNNKKRKTETPRRKKIQENSNGDLQTISGDQLVEVTSTTLEDDGTLNESNHF